MVRGAIWVGVTAIVATSVAALAQISVQGPQDRNQKRVFLVRKDVSECSGSDVPTRIPLWLSRNAAEGTLWLRQKYINAEGDYESCERCAHTT
jgi:hypothetical protein